MKGYSELKKLAEAATQGQWNAVDYGSFNGKSSHWYVETKSGENVAFDDSGDLAPNHWDERGEHDMKFIASANPAAVLALIAELEILEYDCKVANSCVNAEKKESKRIIDENESLKKDAARYRWLRDSKRFDDEDPLGQLACGETEGEDLLFDSDLDHAIDMYMVWIKDKDIK